MTANRRRAPAAGAPRASARTGGTGIGAIAVRRRVVDAVEAIGAIRIFANNRLVGGANNNRSVGAACWVRGRKSRVSEAEGSRRL